MSGAGLGDAALTLVGARFRLGGRDPATGLDCIGVLSAALARCGRGAALPNGYTLRLRSLDQWLPAPQSCGFGPASKPFEPGDVVMIGLGAGQFHLAVAAPDMGWVHAHAGLQRVVHTAELPPGQILHHWRLLPAT